MCYSNENFRYLKIKLEKEGMDDDEVIEKMG